MGSLNYKPDGNVLKEFLKDDTFFRGIRGPVGSGKSVACCIEIIKRAINQKPSDDGIRKTRWAVIRNTNPQLKTTTIKTWLDWFPEDDWGNFTWSVPYTHKLKKGDIECEVIFLALDRPEDVKKLLSLELTGVWINEAREIAWKQLWYEEEVINLRQSRLEKKALRNLKSSSTGSIQPLLTMYK